MLARVAEILALGEGEPCLSRVERYSLDRKAKGNDKSIFWNLCLFCFQYLFIAPRRVREGTYWQ